MSSAYPAGLRAWTSELNVRLIVEFCSKLDNLCKKDTVSAPTIPQFRIVDCRALKLSVHNQYFNDVLIKYKCELDPNFKRNLARSRRLDMKLSSKSRLHYLLPIQMDGYDIYIYRLPLTTHSFAHLMVVQI